MSSANTCSICLATAQARGGVPLFSPGCCGAWYHQTCIDAVIAAGGKNCPLCRKELPAPVAVAVPLPPGPQPALQQQQLPPFPIVQQRVSNVGPPQSNIGFFNRIGNVISSVFSPVPADEDPVTPQRTPVSTGAGSAVPTVTVSAAPEYNEVSLDENNSFHVRVSLKYEEVEALSVAKVPLDVVCVLDNSGSMSGSKLTSLKKAMEFVIQSLGPHDRLSVVNFNSQPTVLHGLLKMNPSNQATAKSSIYRLSATGGTDIYAGMQQGWSLLESRRTRNPASCMFLLTDGQDRDHTAEKLELARRMKSAGTSLFVFGFGTDHDSEHMDAIADAAEGVFTYVETDDMVTDAFGGTIGTQQGVSLCNLRLALEACEYNVVISQVLAGRYAHALQADGRAGSVTFVNMFLGESRDILLQLRVPAVSEPVADYELIRASATFQVQGEAPSTAAPHSTADPARCVVQRMKPGAFSEAGRVRDVGVDVHINRLEAVAAVAAALREADNQNFDSAREILRRCKATVGASPSYNAGNNTSVALMAETEDALRTVENRSEYQRGGRAMMQECVSANANQRSCYTKAGRANNYQTMSSAGMQERAWLSKGSK